MFPIFHLTSKPRNHLQNPPQAKWLLAFICEYYDSNFVGAINILVCVILSAPG